MKTEKILDYPFTIRHLSKEDGGGYFIEFPDLPGCMSNGETLEEAIENGQDAVICWLKAAKELGRATPKPGELENQSGKWVQRVPKSIHLRLTEKAEAEGVSLNTLVITILAEALGKNNLHAKGGASQKLISAMRPKASLAAKTRTRKNS